MVQDDFFDRADVDQYRPVAIIDQQLAAALFRRTKSDSTSTLRIWKSVYSHWVTETKSDGSQFKTQGTMWLIESYATAIQGKFQFSSLQISPHRLQDMKELKKSRTSFVTTLSPNNGNYDRQC